MKFKKAKLFVFALSLFLIIIIGSFPSFNKHYNYLNSNPLVDNGMIDFNGRSINNQNNICLDGEWQFFDNVWIKTDELEGLDSVMVKVPFNINRYKINGEYHKKESTICSFKLDLYNLSIGDIITFDIYHSDVAFRVFFNDELVSTNGYLSKIKGQSFSYAQSIVKKDVIITEDNAYHSELVIEVSSNLYSGINNIPTINSSELARLKKTLYPSIDFLLVALILSLLIFTFSYSINLNNKKELTYSIIYKVFLIIGCLLSRTPFYLLQQMFSGFFSFDYANLIAPIFLYLSLIVYLLRVKYYFNFKNEFITNIVKAVSLIVYLIAFSYHAIFLNTINTRQASFFPMVILFIYVIFIIVNNYNKCLSRKPLLVITCVYIYCLFIILSSLYGNSRARFQKSFFQIFLFFIYMITILIFTADDNKKRMELAKEAISAKEELVEKNILILRSQIKPHFIYNTLNVIKYLCKTNPKEAEQAIVKFASFLRRNINSLDDNKCIPFIDELEHTKNYIDIEKIRFGDKLKVIFDIQIENFLIPSLSIQPLVENCIKHGVSKKVDGGLIKIRTYEDENNYLIEISDNGVGFELNELYDKKKHIGTENVSMRLSLMCKGTLEIKSQKNVGTKYIISIPKTEGD